MKIWIIIILIAGLGIALGIWNRWESSDIRWSPLYERPLPEPHSTTKFVLRGDSGDFEITVKRPMSLSTKQDTISLVEQAPISCHLIFRVYSEERLISTVEVASLRQTGIIGSSHEDCFIGGLVTLPKLGEYTIAVSNMGEEFKTREANFSLLRKENAANSAVWSGVSMVISRALIGASILMAVFSYARYLPTRKR